MTPASDLSNYSRPISGLFPTLPVDAALKRFQLSKDSIDHFEEHGFVAGIPVLDQPQIEALRQELAELTEPDCDGRELFYEYHSNESADPNHTLFHALGAWRTRPGFHDLLWHPAFTVPASQLLGGPVRFWHDQLFCKPARHGGVVAWHQDYSYWTRTSPMAHLTCWIGLDDSDEHNGGLYYVPGSHRWDLLPITGLAGDMNAIQEVLSEAQREQFQPVPMRMKAGEAAFHHPLMVHGSFENHTELPRRAVVLNVIRDGVRSESNEPLLEGVPVISAGQTLSGAFFPMLFDPQPGG